MDISDVQWALLEPLFRPKRREDGRGRPWQDTRAVLNGVFWVLRTGAPRHDLPSRYPSYQTCHASNIGSAEGFPLAVHSRSAITGLRGSDFPCIGDSVN